MIDKFQIGNFKAFSDMQTIPLKPITIIFGPNSSGKSSVIHSLLLARHGVDTQSLDATYPSIAGKSVDLGGFRQYVHRRNLENRLQWVAEMRVASLPANLANDLAKANLLTVHLTAGLQLDDHGHPAQGAAPFTQTCEYRIDGELFMRLTRKERQGDFLLSQLNRAHAVFEPILQAMLLSSRSHQSLNADDSELLAKLVDEIVPQIQFSGESDFLPGTEFAPDLLAQMDRSLSKGNDTADFGKLGDLGKSVRLFLPRTIMRFHAGVQETLTSSLKSLSYLGPLRALPPRHTAFLEPEALGAAAAGGQAWRELVTNAAVRARVNEWMKKLQTPYRLDVQPFFAADMVSELAVDEAAESLRDFIQDILTKLNADELWAINEQAESYEEALMKYGDAGDLDNPEMRSIGDGYHSMVEEFMGRSYDADTRGYVLKQRLLQNSNDGGDLLLFDVGRKTTVSHRDVGIGVSQVLPVLVEAYASRNRIIAMEQPEIHLHPALQAELGDVFIESALGEQQNRFLLETHSEHLILRILRRIRESAKKSNPTIKASDVAVLYVEPSPDGAEVYEMEISDDGQILSQWPGGFFPERMKEMFGEL